MLFFLAEEQSKALDTGLGPSIQGTVLFPVPCQSKCANGPIPGAKIETSKISLYGHETIDFR